MTSTTQDPSATTAVSVGMLGLAGAMGIGRFSLTPIMPLMQEDSSLTLAQGSWLATSNYVGYLIGALICVAVSLRPADAIRWGMVAVGLFTLAMGLTRSLPLWIAFRLLAGIASAFVLVGVSAWAMPILARRGKEQWYGRIFAGVGLGIAIAGLIALAAGVAAWGSQGTWIILGVIACALGVLLWISLTPDGNLTTSSTPGKPGNLSSRAWIAAGCYSAFGYGYIIPATFLPALARGYINNPAIFGWIWPVFGLAAAISTLLATKFLNRPPRRLWIEAQWVLAAGVTAPVLAVNVMTLLIAAVCVGGSFMVITMAGIKQALPLGGAGATKAIGMMTAGFGIGQIAGPLIVGLFAGSSSSFVVPSLIAVAALIASNVTLYAVNALDENTQGVLGGQADFAREVPPGVEKR